MKRTLICPCCGKEFQTNYGSKIFCCHHCYVKSRNKRIRELTNSPYNVTHCQICGADLNKSPLKHSDARVTCSDECQAKLIENLKKNWSTK